MTIERNILGERAGSVSAFVGSCLLGLNDDPTPMDIDEATWTMENWRQDGVEYPASMTAEILIDAWNAAVYNYNNQTKEDLAMKNISIDNGHSFCTPTEAVSALPWNAIVALMDDETCETVAREYAPCENVEFLTRYLEIAPADLIIG